MIPAKRLAPNVSVPATWRGWSSTPARPPLSMSGPSTNGTTPGPAVALAVAAPPSPAGRPPVP
jgi:hypothetical protein